MDNTDDEALNWAGDDARQRGGGTWSLPKRREGASLSPSPEPDDGEEARRSSDGEAVVSRPDESGFDTSTPSTTQPASIADSAALVATGVFAGIYLLFTVAWLITAFRDPVHFADALAEAMFIGGLWAAVLAGPAVFVATLVFTEKRPRAIRFVLLIAGALVLVPWPYFTWAG